MKRLLSALFGLLVFVAVPARAAESRIVLVLPFENSSSVPGIDWIGESFPDVLGDRLASTSVYVIPRKDREYAFDRLGIPAALHPSRATLYRIGEEMDVDYLVLGSYGYDGRNFTCRAQIMDLRRLRLSPAVAETGALTDLLNVETALSWDIAQTIEPDQFTSREAFMAAAPAVRLDAFENYIRGISESDPQERIRRFQQALKLNPSYGKALLALGHAYFDVRDYQSAATTLERVDNDDPEDAEARFFLGLSAYYSGNYDRALRAFDEVARKLPLPEVQNNLGVLQSRLGKKNAADTFQRAVDIDPRDEDYRFNLGLALVRSSDFSAAQDQLKQALALRPQDTEAKQLLSIANKSSLAADQRLPLERIKRNYDESSYRQLILEVENARERHLVNLPPRQHAEAHVTHATESIAAGNLGLARRELREAILLDPANAKAHVALADLLERIGEDANARKEAEASLRLQPSVNAFLVLARLDAKEQKLDSAQKNVEDALRLEPGNAAALELRRSLQSKLEGATPR